MEWFDIWQFWQLALFIYFFLHIFSKQSNGEISE
jgi:hypothetical protein